MANVGYDDTPQLPGRKWLVHDGSRPQPRVVTPGAAGGAPSDAVVLFDGTDLSAWKGRDGAAAWKVEGGYMEVAPGTGDIQTVEQFGDCQLHLEFRSPHEVKGDSQGRGNSGVFLPGGIEVQVLDNYNNPTYPDGTAGCVYGVMPPAANALRPSGEWQSYDIIYRRPVAKDGKVVDEGSMTVLMNGVVVQDSTPLEGGGGHRRRSNPARTFPDEGRIKFQDHGNPVCFRNVWVRHLRPRPVDGGTDGRLTKEAAMAKRNQIAEEIRADAAKKQGYDKALRQLESLTYAADDSAWAEADAFIVGYVRDLTATPAKEMGPKRGAISGLYKALSYMKRHSLIPGDYLPLTNLGKIMDAQGWRR